MNSASSVKEGDGKAYIQRVRGSEQDFKHLKMMQCMDAATRELSVQLIVKSAGGTITLRAFGKTVQDISQKPADEVTMRVLLKAKQFNLIHGDGIIQSISGRV